MTQDTEIPEIKAEHVDAYAQLYGLDVTGWAQSSSYAVIILTLADGTHWNANESDVLAAPGHVATMRAAEAMPATYLRALAEARGLMSDDGENPEYDRALAELLARIWPVADMPTDVRASFIEHDMRSDSMIPAPDGFEIAYADMASETAGDLIANMEGYCVQVLRAEYPPFYAALRGVTIDERSGMQVLRLQEWNDLNSEADGPIHMLAMYDGIRLVVQ